jgi:hypothetical protein
MKHGHEHAAGHDMQQRHGHAAWKWHAAYTGTCSMDKDIQHGHGLQHRQGACSMEMDMQQVLDVNVFISMSMSTVAMGTARSPDLKKKFSSHLV